MRISHTICAPHACKPAPEQDCTSPFSFALLFSERTCGWPPSQNSCQCSDAAVETSCLSTVADADSGRYTMEKRHDSDQRPRMVATPLFDGGWHQRCADCFTQ